LIYFALNQINRGKAKLFVAFISVGLSWLHVPETLLIFPEQSIPYRTSLQTKHSFQGSNYPIFFEASAD